MPINDQVLKLAFEGKWDVLLPVLRNYPLLINRLVSPKVIPHYIRQHGTGLIYLLLQSYCLSVLIAVHVRI